MFSLRERVIKNHFTFTFTLTLTFTFTYINTMTGTARGQFRRATADGESLKLFTHAFTPLEATRSATRHRWQRELWC
jgi:hypothetical protein